MISTDKRYEENVPGKYYVTDSCDGCGRCRRIHQRREAWKRNSKRQATLIMREFPARPQEPESSVLQSRHGGSKIGMCADSAMMP